MIDVSPSGAANDSATGDGRGSGVFANTVAMKMDGVSPARICSRSRDELPVGIELWVVDDLKLVGTPEVIESGIRDLYIAIVHEHHVSSSIRCRVF